MERLESLTRYLKQLQAERDQIADTRRSILQNGITTKTCGASPIERAAEKREKIEKKIEHIQAEIEREKKTILDQIAGINNSYDRMIYYLRRVKLMSFKEIGRKFGKTDIAIAKYFEKRWGEKRK